MYPLTRSFQVIRKRKRTQWERLVDDDLLRPFPPGNHQEVLIFESPTHIEYALLPAGKSITAYDPMDPEQFVPTTATWSRGTIPDPVPPWPRNRSERRALPKITAQRLQQAKRILGPVEEPHRWNARFWDLIQPQRG